MTGLLLHGWAGIALLACLGLVCGSFLNVVIHRVPLMLNRAWDRQAREQLHGEHAAAPVEADDPPFNLFVPGSRCPACGHRIRAIENIPVLSWLALKGRCSSCASTISARYPIIEILTACAFLAAAALFGWTWTATAAAIYSGFLIALAGIDFDTRMLPDQLTLPLLWAGLITNAFGGFVELEAAVLGAAGAYLFLWSLYWAFKALSGKEGMGYGDFKLFAAIGAWLGWTVLPGVILVAAVLGLGYALAAILAGRRDRHQPLPFGPFLATAGWLALLVQHQALVSLPI